MFKYTLLGNITSAGIRENLSGSLKSVMELSTILVDCIKKSKLLTL
jgi:hypothetical protein